MCCHRATEKEKTLAMIKPKGFSLARSFCVEHSSKSFFPSAVKYMTSIRALCGVSTERNCVHGSDSVKSASKEISFFLGYVEILMSQFSHDELLADRNAVTMKFFNWMQNKINGKAASQTPSAVPVNNDPKQPPKREEFNYWPHGLLTIGTFGNNDLQDRGITSEIQPVASMEKEQNNPISASSPDMSEFTPEEVGQLQKELIKLLKRKPAKQEEQNLDLPLDRFLNCPSSLEVSRRMSNAVLSDLDHKDDIERTISVIIGKCKEVRAEKSKNAIGKKSLSFLLNKVFVCANGFSPSPSLRDTLQESRMEKLLRTMLHKKIYQQNSSRTPTSKKCIQEKPFARNRSDVEADEKPRPSEGCKWDKTDSEYIVLDI